MGSPQNLKAVTKFLTLAFSPPQSKRKTVRFLMAVLKIKYLKPVVQKKKKKINFFFLLFCDVCSVYFLNGHGQDCISISYFSFKRP